MEAWRPMKKAPASAPADRGLKEQGFATSQSCSLFLGIPWEQGGLTFTSCPYQGVCPTMRYGNEYSGPQLLYLVPLGNFCRVSWQLLTNLPRAGPSGPCHQPSLPWGWAWGPRQAGRRQRATVPRAGPWNWGRGVVTHHTAEADQETRGPLSAVATRWENQIFTNGPCLKSRRRSNYRATDLCFLLP